MSESIHIDSIQFDDGSTSIPKWSTEATLERVLAKLPRGGRIETDLRAVVDTLREARNTDRKAHADATKSLKSIQGAIERSGEKIKRVETATKKSSQEDRTKEREGRRKLVEERRSRRELSGIVSPVTALSSNLFELNKGVVDIKGPFRRFPNVLAPILKKFPALGLVTVGLSAVFGTLTTLTGRYISILMDSANVFRGLNEVGLRGIETSSQLYGNLQTLTMSSSEFQKIMTDYSTAMNTFGMESLRNVISATGDAERKFSDFGMTTAEGTQFLARQLQQQRLSGVFTLRSEEEQRESLEKSIETVSAFSTMMGISRQRIMENLTQILEQDRMRAVFASMRDREQREAISQTIGTVIKMFTALGGPGERFADFFTEMTSVLDPVMAESFQQLVPFAGETAMVMANLSREVQNLESAMNPDMVTERMFALGEALERDRDRITFMARMGDQTARQAASMLMQFEEMRTNFERIARRERISVQEVARNRARADAELASSSAILQDQLVRIRIGFNRLLINLFDVILGSRDAAETMQLLERIGTSLGNAFVRMSEWLESFFTEEHSALSFFERLGLLFSKGVEAMFQAVADTMARSDNVLVRGAGRLLGGIAATDPIERERERLGITGQVGVVRGIRDVVSPLGLFNPLTPTISSVTSDWKRDRKLGELESLLGHDGLSGVDRQHMGVIRTAALSQLTEGVDPQAAVKKAFKESTDSLKNEIELLNKNMKDANDEELESLRQQIAELRENKEAIKAVRNAIRETE